MKKLISFSGLLSVGLVLGSSLAMANTIVLSGTGNTTAQTVTGSNGSLTLNAAGTLTVSGNTAAVTLNGSNPSTITVTNNGTISQTGTSNALVDAGGHMTITINNGSSTNSSATLKTTAGDVIHLDHATNNVTLNNYGSITSQNTSAGGNQAIDWNGLTDGGVAAQGSNTLNNYSTGTITATEADAVRPGINGFIYNSGTIKSTTTTGSSSDGIDAQSNTGVTITNAAGLGTGGANLIEGGRHGITGGNTTGTGAYTMSITNNAHGTIQGDNGSGVNIDGINGNETVTITNAGTITGNGVTGDGDGVDVDGLVNLTNSGTIQSLNSYADTSEGVTVGGGSIINSGTIEGSVTTAGAASGSTGRGITLAGVDKDSNDNPIPIQTIYANTTVTNNSGGLIKGDSDSGITIEGLSGPTTFTVSITNNANATIEGGGSTVAAIEAGASANNLAITNSGTIKADKSGKAIDFGSGTNSLTIQGTSAQIDGDITGGTGANTVKIDKNASFNYGGTISKVSNLTLVANSSFAAGGTQPAPITDGSANTANGNLTFDTTGLTSGSTIMNVTDANLTFALGSGGATSGSKIIVTGGVANTIAFSGDDSVTINDLVGDNLISHLEYVLIAGDATSFSGLGFGATSSYGKLITSGLNLTTGNTFSQTYSTSQLYLKGNNIDVVVTPEPKSLLLVLVALFAGIGLHLRRRQLKA